MIMAITAGINIFFTHRDVGNAMLETQEQSIRKILGYVTFDTKEEYRRLLSDKMQMTLKKKKRLKQTALLILSVLKSYDSIPKEISSSKENIKNWAKEWIANVPFKEFNYLILDNKAQLIYSSTPDFTQASMKSLKDVKGRILSQVMRHDKLSSAGDYAVLKSNKAGKLIYFVPFHQWKYTIVTAIDIDDIELEAQRKLDKIITILSEISKHVVGFKDGYSFMFNSKLEFLISPPNDILQSLKSGKNINTDNFILNDMMETAKSDKKKIIYILSNDPLHRQMSTSLSYFRNLDWYIGVTVPLEEIKRPAKDLVFRQSLIIAIILILSLIFIRIIVVRIASPLKLLALYAKNLPNQDFTKDNLEENSIKNLPLHYKDEIGELASSFIFMETELKKNIKNLVKVTAGREKIQSELNIAREIQMGIIPKTFPPFPEYDEFDIFATLKPAREVGGDLYDFFRLDKDHICFTLGDVSDKGVPAALFMVITRTLIKTSAEHEKSPGAIMSNINNILATDNPRSMFVTLIIGILNFRTGHITYANGGHNPPVFIPAIEKPYFKHQKIEPIVGVMPNVSYSDFCIDLNPGDCFLLYTDGVTEAMNNEKQCFSEEKLLKTVEYNKGKSIDAIIGTIMEDIMSHKGSAIQSDDIAMLLLKYN